MLRPLVKTNTGDTKLGPIFRPFASYKYIKYYDSCTITCLFTTFKLNQSRIRLLNFCQMKRRLEGNTDSLRIANSKTDFFTLRKGDSLSFFRRFNWISSIKQNRDYSSEDTLSFSV